MVSASTNYPTDPMTDTDIESGPETGGAVYGVNAEEKGGLVVDWDGPDDPANPRNWSHGTQMVQIALVSVFTLYANLATTMFAPGLPALIGEFGITNDVIGALTVTIYILGFSLGPLLLAPLSELYGRLPVYLAADVFFIAFIAGCAVSKNVAMFILFRFTSGCAASVPMNVGGGTIADLFPVEKRGKAMALYGIGPLLGPVLGPVLGGFVSQGIGWRWTFWLVDILAGTFLILAAFLLRETNEMVLLDRKAARLRMATGRPYVARTSEALRPSKRLARAIVRPLKLLVFSPILLFMSLYSGLAFGLLFLLFATFSLVFQEYYGFGLGTAGLAYLGLGVGMICGLILFGVLSDKLLNQPTGGTVARPELRLPLMIWFVPSIPIGFFWYGWSAQNHTHWMIPIMGTFFVGIGAFFVVMPTQMYLVDVFGQRGAASALAANSVIRNLFATFLAMAAGPLYNSTGMGWGNTLLGCMTILFCPIPIFFYKYGERLRSRFTVEL